MKTRWIYGLACAFLLTASVTQSADRQWTDTKGKSMEAEFVGVTVLLQKPDGTKTSVPLESLSEADREFVIAQLKPTVAEEETLPEAAVQDEQKAGTKKVLKIKGVTYTFRWCPAGTFIMGSPKDELGRHLSYPDETQHEVTLTQGFWMLETEVTREMWKSVTGEDPSQYRYEDNSKILPVRNVSWEDCREYIGELNALKAAPGGYKFSFPTEAQWEYACRAGTMTALNNGKNLTSSTDICRNMNEVGWYKSLDYNIHKVGLKKPNAWGLYDMHGNVSEWCLDRFGPYQNDSVTDPTGPETGSYRVDRGGSWCHVAGCCRSAYRTANYTPSSRSGTLGLRLALVRE